MPVLVRPALPAGRLSQLTQPVLTAGALVIRPWRRSDVDAVVAAYADPEIQQWHVRSMTPLEARDWIEHWPVRWARETGAGWAVEGAGAVVGQVGLREVDLAQACVEISYWVVPTARRQGVAPAALDAVTEWAFAQAGMVRAELAHSTSNPASCRVATKAGYLPEGTARRQVLHADGWHDMHQHARLRMDAARGTSTRPEGGLR